MLPSEITTTMEYSDPDHPLANSYIRTWKTLHAKAKSEGKGIDEMEYKQELAAFDKPINERIKNFMRDKGIGNEDIQCWDFRSRRHTTLSSTHHA